MADLINNEKDNMELDFELFNGWMTRNIAPCDWSKPSRYKNYLAIVDMDENGNESRDYCKPSDEGDLYFNVSSAKVGDIIVSSCWDSRKERQQKLYYLIIDIDKEYMTTTTPFTTYRKAAKYRQSEMTSQ